MDPTIIMAEQVCIMAHEGQVRKYSGEPYWTHPAAVAALVSTVTADAEIIAAAYLHDVVEDTSVSLEEIREAFGDRVASLVENLTDVSKPEHGNRAARKFIDRMHTKNAHPDAKTIKLADLIDNAKSIQLHDEAFAAVYMAEKRALLTVLGDGDAMLFAQAYAIVEGYYAGLG